MQLQIMCFWVPMEIQMQLGKPWCWSWCTTTWSVDNWRLPVAFCPSAVSKPPEANGDIIFCKQSQNVFNVIKQYFLQSSICIIVTPMHGSPHNGTTCFPWGCLVARILAWTQYALDWLPVLELGLGLLGAKAVAQPGSPDTEKFCVSSQPGPCDAEMSTRGRAQNVRRLIGQATKQILPLDRLKLQTNAN